MTANDKIWPGANNRLDFRLYIYNLIQWRDTTDCVPEGLRKSSPTSWYQNLAFSQVLTYWGQDASWPIALYSMQNFYSINLCSSFFYLATTSQAFLVKLVDYWRGCSVFTKEKNPLDNNRTTIVVLFCPAIFPPLH